MSQEIDCARWAEGHIFSATELESTLACPFRLYAEAILGLKEPEEREVELSPPELGDLLHRILARYRPGIGKNLLAEADEIIAAVPLRRPGLCLPLLERKKGMIRRTLGAFLEAEERREKETGLTPRFTEWSFGSGNVPPLEIRDGRRVIRIRGRVDRIDVDPKRKRFLVIDYKTGSTKTTGAAIERGEALQLPLYILAVRQFCLPDYEPIGGLYYRLADLTLQEGILHTDRLPDGLALSTRSSTLIPPARWETLFERTAQRVREVVASIRRNFFPSRPDDCRPNCPYRVICLLRRGAA